jgi:sugar/nucleoside kinase (ribokinase family)
LNRNVLARVLARTDVLTANAREARIATGGSAPPAAARDLVTKIRAKGMVLVRDGARGC